MFEILLLCAPENLAVSEPLEPGEWLAITLKLVNTPRQLVYTFTTVMKYTIKRKSKYARK